MKFLKIAVCLWVTIASLTLLAQQVSRTQAEKNTFALFFADVNGAQCPQLCIIGITPGITPVSDVSGLFAAHPLSKDLKISEVSNAVQALHNPEMTTLHTGFTAIYHDENRTVQQMSWSAQVNTYPYKSADAVALFGEPDCVLVGSANNSFFYLPGLLVVIGQQNVNRLNLHDPIMQVILYRDNIVMDCDQPFLLKWRGFASNRQYKAP